MKAGSTKKVTYYLSGPDYESIKIMAKYLYDEGGIPRPTLGAYSHAAALKMFKELYERLPSSTKAHFAKKLKPAQENYTPQKGMS